MSALSLGPVLSRAHLGTNTTHAKGARAAQITTERHPDPKVRAARANGAWQMLDSPHITTAELETACRILLRNTDKNDPRRKTCTDLLDSVSGTDAHHGSGAGSSAKSGRA